MSDLKEILKEEYFKQANKLDINTLLSMVEHAVTSALDEDVAIPAAMDFDPDSDEQAIEMILKMIPNIEVSEIGWSDLRTPTDGGKEVAGPQRKLLEDYLSNIQGADFAERIRNVSRFYSDGTGMIQETAGDDRTRRIVQAISYLVFYKTLTKVITNFNASSAGFSFESFLAALTSGKQIEANTGTIADYIDRADGSTIIPVSLKLYREGGLEVGGSYTDLVRDLTMVGPKTEMWASSFPNAMRYVICTKALKGDDLDQRGDIHFYQFDFTLNNVVDIIANSKERSQKCIMLPKSVISALKGGQQSGVDLDLPDAGTLPSPEQLESVFLTQLETEIVKREIPMSEEAFKTLADVLDWAKNDKLFQDADPARFGGAESPGVVRGISALQSQEVRGIVKALFEKALPWRPNGREALASAIGAANKYVRSQHTATKKADERTQEIVRMVRDGEFYTPEESVREYELLKSTERKKIALLNSWGYLTTGHFSLNQKQSINSGPPTNTIDLGIIQVGRAEVKNVVDNIRDILNEEVTEIFQSLKILSDSLNTFFAGGLKDDGMATASIENANNISSKEILQTNK
jgi:hypothetical protein